MQQYIAIDRAVTKKFACDLQEEDDQEEMEDIHTVGHLTDPDDPLILEQHRPERIPPDGREDH